MKSYVNAYGERMTEAQEQQLERRLGLDQPFRSSCQDMSD
jgi:hypothetical protein